MPLAMPYHLETGYSLFAIEAALNNATPQQLIVLLNDLRSSAPLDTLIAQHTPNPQNPVTGVLLAQAVRDAWLGARTKPNVDAEYSPTSAPNGKWLGYEGYAETILRQTFIRAIEISLGIPVGAEPDSVRPKPWPFMLMWKCSQPWLEGWVQWRPGRDGADGMVVVVLCTPSDGSHISMDVAMYGVTEPAPGQPTPPTPTGATALAKAAADGYRAAYTGSHTARGSIVTTHRTHRLIPTKSISTATSAAQNVNQIGFGGSGTGQTGGAPLPSFGGTYIGHDPVITVSPRFADGGVN